METREDYVTVIPSNGTVTRALALRPVLDIAEMLDTRAQIVALLRRVMVEKVDYGQIPGTPKPTLYKPGAEKLARFFGLRTIPELLACTEQWSDGQAEAFFMYKYRMTAYLGDTPIAVYDGLCHSHEEKYRWRWVPEADVPFYLDKAQLVQRVGEVTELKFAVDRAETAGKYGKPAEYWRMFQDAIKTQQARRVFKEIKGKRYDAWEISGAVYRVPNPAVEDLAHTISAIAQKRALVGAIRIATNATDIFQVSDYVGEVEDEQPDTFGSDVRAGASDKTPEEDAADLFGPPPARPAAEQPAATTRADAINAIRKWCGQRPQAERERPPADGRLGLMNGRLTRSLGGDPGRKAFIKDVFAKESSKGLSEAQVEAVLAASDATIKAVALSPEPVGK